MAMRRAYYNVRNRAHYAQLLDFGPESAPDGRRVGPESGRERGLRGQDVVGRWPPLSRRRDGDPGVGCRAHRGEDALALLPVSDRAHDAALGGRGVGDVEMRVVVPAEPDFGASASVVRLRERK